MVAPHHCFFSEWFDSRKNIEKTPKLKQAKLALTRLFRPDETTHVRRLLSFTDSQTVVSSSVFHFHVMCSSECGSSSHLQQKRQKHLATSTTMSTSSHLQENNRLFRNACNILQLLCYTFHTLIVGSFNCLSNMLNDLRLFGVFSNLREDSCATKPDHVPTKKPSARPEGTDCKAVLASVIKQESQYA